jgi:hypothetical protein
MEQDQANPAPWTFLDVMATAIALVPEPKLLASDKSWNLAWQRITSDPDLAALLPEVDFEDRSPYPPLSDQVETLRRILRRSSVLSLLNPRYLYFSIEDEAKESIKRTNQILLDREGERLQRMADVLSEELSPS